MKVKYLILENLENLTIPYLSDSGIKTDVIHALERRVPNHFLVIALIKQLCSLYIIDNPKKCSETFNGNLNKFTYVVPLSNQNHVKLCKNGVLCVLSIGLKP